MQPIITENRGKIVELCKTHHVRKLSAFGSAVRDDFDSVRSDIDLLVEFEALGEMDYAPNYFSFIAALDSLLGRDIDLLTDKYVKNPYLRQSIDADKVLLYAA